MSKPKKHKTNRSKSIRTSELISQNKQERKTLENKLTKLGEESKKLTQILNNNDYTEEDIYREISDIVTSTIENIESMFLPPKYANDKIHISHNHGPEIQNISYLDEYNDIISRFDSAYKYIKNNLADTAEKIMHVENTLNEIIQDDISRKAYEQPFYLKTIRFMILTLDMIKSGLVEKDNSLLTLRNTMHLLSKEEIDKREGDIAIEIRSLIDRVDVLKDRIDRIFSHKLTSEHSWLLYLKKYLMALTKRTYLDSHEISTTLAYCADLNETLKPYKEETYSPLSKADDRCFSDCIDLLRENIERLNQLSIEVPKQKYPKTAMMRILIIY